MSDYDPYLELIDEQWHNIVMVYETFKGKKPIIEYDVVDKKIYSYPAKDYSQTLSVRTRKQTKKQYRETVRKNQFI